MINYKKEVFVDASIKGTVRASDKDAQYDEKAKKLLGWTAERGLLEMCKDSWRFTEKNL